MSSAARQPLPLNSFEQLQLGREILRLESRAIGELSRRLDAAFQQAVQLLFECTGSVIVTGMGKAGLVGQKIAATLASTGTRSHFLHPAEAVHGDLGRVHETDVVLVLSQSGETEETIRILPSLGHLPLIAITGRPQSTLARAASVALNIGPVREACTLGLAPSTSTTAMLALGDALALVTSRLRGFRAEDFARFHPGGSLGRQLAKVEEAMRPRELCRIALDTDTVRQIFVALERPGRRTGAIMLTSADGKLTGIFTDSDLARLFERRNDQAFDHSIRAVMTPRPTSILVGTPLIEAVRVLVERKFSELPVVDDENRPVGMLDITDVIALLPQEHVTTLDDEPSPATVPFRRP